MPRALEHLIAKLGPDLYWPLDEPSGTSAADRSGNARNGTYVGSPSLRQSFNVLKGGGYAVDLDGSAHYISSTWDPGPFVNAATRTFVGFAQRDSTGSNDILVAGDQASTHPLVRIIPAGDVQLWLDFNLGSPSAIWAGAWNDTDPHAWALVVNMAGGVASLYLNGAIVATESLSIGHTYSTPGAFKAGARGATTSDAFDGKMAQLAVFARALTAKEVREIYKTGIAGIWG